MNKEPNILIIGAGGIVRDAHLPAYKIAGFKIAGIFDVNIDKAQKLVSNFDIPKVFHSLAEAINASDVLTVFDLAVPGKEILGVLKDIPDASVILIQKPMGEDLQMAKDILDLCRKKKLKAGINFQLRYAPFVQKAKKLIEEGKIGKLCDIEINVNVFTPWNLWEFLYDTKRVEILYHSIHYIDLVRSFFGNPEKIYARTVKHPKTKELASVKSNIIMDYGDYLRANILTNHNHNFGEKHQTSYIKLEGTQGAIRMSMGVLKAYPEGLVDQFEYVEYKKEEKPLWKKINIEGTWFPHAFIGSMKEMINTRVKKDYVPDNSVEDCINTMACVEAAYLSNAIGGIRLGDVSNFKLGGL